MAVFLRYDGRSLYWEEGTTRKAFLASSGIHATPIRAFRVGTVVYCFREDYRWRWYEKVKDRGPIPSGTYTVESRILKQPWAERKAQSCELIVAWGIQKIPRGDPNPDKDGDQPTLTTAGDCDPYWANWGSNRVRLSPHKDMVAPHRDGFYVHDSVKGFSHGCIETELDFFVKYLFPYATKNPNKRFYLGVDYKHERTYGGTLAAGGHDSLPGVPEAQQIEALVALRKLCARLQKNAPLPEEVVDAKATSRTRRLSVDPPPQDRLIEYDHSLNLRYGANDLRKDPAKAALFKGWWGNFA